MSDVNHLEIQGRLTRDAELKYTNDGTALTSFSIATEFSWKKGAEWEKKVSYFDVTAWGNLAAIAGQLIKGTPVLVIGRLEQQRWEKDGKTNSKVVIVAEKIFELKFPKKQGEEV